MMLVNGLAQETISLSDRALNYGDGVFETIRLQHGRPILFQQHMQRLQLGSERLGIACDFSLLQKELADLQDQFTTAGVLKIIISRGQGGRGYRPAKQMQATRIISLHPLPDYSAFDQQAGVQVFVCQHRLSEQTNLAGIKHLNRLDQVMASREWPDERYFEGLMCDQQGSLVEGTRSNLFMARAGKLYTPGIINCGVAGILRAWLLDKLAGEILELNCLDMPTLLQADEVFLCNSVMGVWPVKRLLLADSEQHYSPGDWTEKARALFDALLESDAAP